jgi:hypothetical protein
LGDYFKTIKRRNSGKLWVINLSLEIQQMEHKMWKSRNEFIHKIQTSETNEKKHADLEQEITEIFVGLPNLGCYHHVS